MTYAKQTWANGIAGATPISAARLNYMEAGIEAAGSAGPTIQVTDYGPFVTATPAERRTTIAAATAVWALTGGTLEYPGGSFDMSGGTAALPLTFLNLHTTYHMKGNNTRFTTTSAHPIFADSWPADNTAAVNRASRRFVVEHCHFLGSGLIGQTGLRIVGSYLSAIRECSFQALEDGLDLVLCLGVKVQSCGYFNNLNNDLRVRYGMEIDNGLGTRTPLWSGAAETNSNGNCPTIEKTRCYAGSPSAAMTVTNKALTSNVATLTVSATLPSQFIVGRWVLVTGVDATFNGIFKITAVPTTTSFTYGKAAADVASAAATGTAQVGQRAQIAIEAISEVIITGCQNEGSQPIDGILYDQGGSTTAKGLTILELHPEQQPLNSHIRVHGTGGGQVLVEGGAWTQGNIMMDASGFTTGNITWSHQSYINGKWRSGGAIWDFIGYSGFDPFLASLWDGAVPVGSYPIRRTAITAREGSGFGNAGVLSFEGIAFISTKNVIRFISENVSPKLALFLGKGIEIGLWNAGANPATQANDTMFFWKNETTKCLVRSVKDSTGAITAQSSPYQNFTTAGRPSAVTVGAGTMVYDTTLSKPIFSDGTVWRDGAGTAV